MKKIVKNTIFQHTECGDFAFFVVGHMIWLALFFGPNILNYKIFLTGITKLQTECLWHE